MAILLTKLVFLLLGLYSAQGYEPQTITMLLSAVTISALVQYFSSAKATALGIGLYSAVCFFFPEGLYFFPALLIDLPDKRHYPILLVPLVIAFTEGDFIWLVLVMALGLISGYLLKKAKNLTAAYSALQDSHTEQSMALRQKNDELMKTQNQAAGMAALQERTRIARDIHDNVGHTLVRGILLTGVLKATNKLPELDESLETLESTLKEAMDTIRSAVHGWKDEALDLYGSVEKLRSGSALDVDLQYDVSEQISTEIKLCFLMVIKEALTNSTKHSNATAIHIRLQEHPSLYQLLIKDNGSRKAGKSTHGMGLSNIEERVLALGGTCTFDNESGFKIFISIPKKR